MSTKLNDLENQVHLSGYICQPPQLMTSRNGKPQLILKLAVKRPAHVPKKLRSDGSEEPDYPPVVIDGDVAIPLSAVLKVSDRVSVNGIFQTRNYTERQPDGNKRGRTAMEVLVASITLPRSDLDVGIVESVATLEAVAPNVQPALESPGDSTITVDVEPMNVPVVEASPKVRGHKKKNRRLPKTYVLAPTTLSSEVSPASALTMPSAPLTAVTTEAQP